MQLKLQTSCKQKNRKTERSESVFLAKAKRERSSEPLFSEGQSVVIKDPDCSDHTRLPGYLRNKVGTIELVYPDSYAYFPGPSDHLQTPQVSYSVKFLPENIWGKEYSETGSVVYADLFECYLSNL